MTLALLCSCQLDTEYRKKWDSLVIKLDVIERDAATGSEVIHWVTHFPVSSASSHPTAAANEAKTLGSKQSVYCKQLQHVQRDLQLPGEEKNRGVKNDPSL